MDPRFGPAWIAFAHTFALEGEHDHAVTAYSTCARMFTGYVFVQSLFVAESLVLIVLLPQFTSSANVCRYGEYHAVKPRLGR